MDVFSLNIPGLMVVGTDTDVGKTYITAAIARQLVAEGVQTGVYKPACSGSVRDENTGACHWPDVEQLSDAIQSSVPVERICPQRFHAPLAPPVAAASEG
ncbi:MAG: AAA family ATPase, partial [Planctomycetaceae bacterium]|nr:AAA family ATPase [Planctomycetaceae bacterium]